MHETKKNNDENNIISTFEKIFITFNLDTKVVKITESEKEKLYDKIFSISNEVDFNNVAMEMFELHYVHNPVYHRFCQLLGIKLSDVCHYSSIPCLPVNIFRKKKVVVAGVDFLDYFESSGTSGSVQGKHFIHDFSVYERSFVECFKKFYGDPSEYAIMALLPAYLERPHSSLVYMTSKLIKLSENKLSAFYLNNHEDLFKNLTLAKREKQKTLLLGVSFAFLDFVEKYSIDFPDLILMETGGMKGRRKEITREELHSRLQIAFDVPSIHGEYGMTELFSQAYSKNAGIFYSPPWMKIILRDVYNPLALAEKKGLINIIDLANVWSCPFLATDDIGQYFENGGFSVLGRADFSVIRGCNTMVDD